MKRVIWIFNFMENHPDGAYLSISPGATREETIQKIDRVLEVVRGLWEEDGRSARWGNTFDALMDARNRELAANQSAQK